VSRFLRAQARSRRRRLAALALAVAATTAAFVLLTAADTTGAARAHGSIERNFRSAYDIIVRPSDSYTPLERREGLVRPNYLSSIFGGITFTQWHEIERIPGVDVAAPVANIGYVLPFASAFFNIGGLVTRARHQVYRFRFYDVAGRNLSRYPNGYGYLYYTHDPLLASPQGPQEVVPGHRNGVPVCMPYHSFSDTTANSPYDPIIHREWLCQSPRNGGSALPSRSGMIHVPPKVVGLSWDGYFPMLLAAVDPVQEARLLHLDRAVVSGRYFRAQERTKPGPCPGCSTSRVLRVPALLASRSFVGERLVAQIERLDLPPEPRLLKILGGSAFFEDLNRLTGHVVSRREIPFTRLYAYGYRRSVWPTQYLVPGPVRYRALGPDRLRPLPTSNPDSIWAATWFGPGFQPVPFEDADVQFHRLKALTGNNSSVDGVLRTPVLIPIGRFDPARLPKFSPLSRVPLETYYPPFLPGADAASRNALGGEPLRPTANIADYVSQPPLLLTTMQGMLSYFNATNWKPTEWHPHYNGKNLGSLLKPPPVPHAKAPISVIRVRVKGVTGPNDVSWARIRAVAVQIHEKTGLGVDVTAGSSPHPVTVDLPAGRFGRPPLALREPWSKKGVSLAFVHALDRKRLALFCLMLVVCGFFLANGAFAVVRSRRVELGTLLTLGWSPRSIFTVVLGELAVVGLVAGVVGAGLAIAVAAGASLELATLRALAVVPLAVGLVAAAGLLPALRAARMTPVAAVRTAPRASRGGGSAGTFLRFALVNLRRLPARTLVGVFGLAVGVAALGLLLAIEASFQGSLVGTLLGNAVALQVRGLDFVAAGLTIALAAVSLADVLLLNLRERAPELVTLRSVGWSEGDLARVVLLEAVLLGLAGSGLGALLALAVGASLALPIGTLLAVSAAAAAGGIAVAAATSLLPVSRLRRLSIPTILAEE
jgi:putative ABC transport system permease protein